METKKCTGCQVTKPLNEFHRSTARGTQNHCKPCKAASKLVWVRKNPDKVRSNHLWSRYRLRPEDFEARLSEQGHSCALCRTGFDDRCTPHVDHDHACCPGIRSCGECVRGLLCGKCNKALGWLEGLDLEKSLAYLGRVHA